MTTDQMQFYQRQQQQSLYYQRHTQEHGTAEPGPSKNRFQSSARVIGEDDDMLDDDASSTDSTASIPDENIDFSLTYALRTFLATVEGQASVVKGDSLLLLDDVNSYWWLVRVLKTEDVGYIPAENIETPFERLARLNKHRNVDLAAPTQQEKQATRVEGLERLKGAIADKAKGVRQEKSGESPEVESGSRRVVFAPPTYVDHPGVTWSTDGEDDDSEGEDEDDLEDVERSQDDIHPEGDEMQSEREREVDAVEESLRRRREMDMEPDDGVEWADGAGEAEQRRILDQKRQQQDQTSPNKNVARSPASSTNSVTPKSNNPFGPRQTPGGIAETSFPSSSSLTSSANGSPILDPAQAGETRRLTVTPQVAQASPGGPLLPSAAVQVNNNVRNVSGQSMGSVMSIVSVGS
ncbi:hypothetical protein TREMEDRAFT_22249, partial [Tremella mesenterica DSM 1558]|uniref:uncharacterized protein n=1 Tax=Tremella mesenterica (strain ATCC 24925 / CBS 8224 / DSM 1558 / NBRC 9311 / NRRL Y-6157 / RJB 2259-6 / UBC 559-6) TaxID=578456 RepID=UPI0003F49905